MRIIAITALAASLSGAAWAEPVPVAAKGCEVVRASDIDEADIEALVASALEDAQSELAMSGLDADTQARIQEQVAEAMAQIGEDFDDEDFVFASARELTPEEEARLEARIEAALARAEAAQERADEIMARLDERMAQVEALNDEEEAQLEARIEAAMERAEAAIERAAEAMERAQERRERHYDVEDVEDDEDLEGGVN